MRKPAFVSVLVSVTAAVSSAHATPEVCVARACDGIAALRAEVAAGSRGVAGRAGLDNHLDVADRKCRLGQLAPAIAQLGAFANAIAGRSPQAVAPATATAWAAAAEALAERLRGLDADGTCVAPVSPVGLVAQCPEAGSLVPLADDFADGVTDPAWLATVAPATVATVAERGGVLALTLGPVAAGTPGQSPFGYVSRCAYPAQDVEVVAEATIDVDATGEYMVQLHADGAALVVGHEAPHGFVALVFADAAPGPDAVAVSLPDLRGRRLGLALARTTSGGGQRVAASVTDLASGDVIFAHDLPRAVPVTTPGRAAILAGFAAGDAPLASATAAAIAVDAYRTTLIAPLPAFVGGRAPWSLDGVAYDDLGTHYLIAGQLTVVTTGDEVAGADGTTSLAVALVTRDGHHVTYYTDLIEADLAAYLAEVAPGASISAYVADVLVAAGPGADYLFAQP